jgi:hypothetical protein
MKLNRVEVAKLLTEVSAIDNRIVDEGRVEAWYPIIKNYDYKDAVEALAGWFQKYDGYLSPRGLIAEIKVIRQERARQAESEARQLEYEAMQGEPQPVCRDHETKIFDCEPCRKRLSLMAPQLHPNDLHNWAKGHLYLESSLV